MAHKFAADLTYHRTPGAPAQQQKVSVNHPLTHRRHRRLPAQPRLRPAHHGAQRGQAASAFSGPVVFLPEDSTFRSFGVVKVPDARQDGGTAGSTQLGLEGEFYPTYAFTDATRAVLGLPRRPQPGAVACSPTRATSASTTALRSRSTRCRRSTCSRSTSPTASRCGSTSPGSQRRHCPTGLGTVDLRRRQSLRQAPGQPHPRPADRARRRGARADRAARLAVHPAAADVGPHPPRGRAYARRGRPGSTAAPAATCPVRSRDSSPRCSRSPDDPRPDQDPVPTTVGPTIRGVVVTHDQFEVLSNQAVAACAVVYFLAVLAHLAQWAAGRKVEGPVAQPWPSRSHSRSP